MILKNDETEVKLKIWKEGFVDEIFFDKNSTVENLPRLEKLLDVQESDFLSLFQEENEVVIEGNIIAMMNGNEIIKYDFKKKYEFMDNNGNYKQNTSFEAVIQNFYFDKNLRMEFLKCSEKIELSIKNKIAYLLGVKYGAFGYLNFSSWCDRSRPKQEIQNEELKFKKKIQKKMKLFSDNSSKV